MELVVLLLVVFAIWLWTRVSALTTHLDQVDRRLLDAFDTIRDLQSQNRNQVGSSFRQTATEQTVATVVTPPVVVVRDDVEAVVEDVPDEQVEPGEPDELAEPAVQPIAEPIVIPVPAQPQPETTPDLVADSEPKESWEITVGTSWLNKIGVLTLVIGIASAVAYAFPLMGPAGRVAIGYVLSGAVLGTGVWLERRDAFRNYAYGLIAGGWAGIYFTTFAMHDVPAARLIESDLMAGSLLLTVAGGMIAHSLKYRSQVVTSLAFVVAYSTLALSPLSGFSLAASVPLAMAVLLVSQRLGWPAISVLGIAATYGVFVIRSQVFPGGAMDPESTLPYATLAVYWLTFEIADLIGLRMRRLENPAGAPFQVSMLALNAAGFLGSIVVISPGTHPEFRSTLMFGTGAAYIVSAIVRAWLLPERRAATDDERRFDVSHAATAMASLLFAIGILLRFRGMRIPLGWLLETQMLFVAALTLSDRWLRRMASIVAVPVTIATALCLVGRGRLVGLPAEAVASILVALIWYANRESLRIKQRIATWMEPGYTWAATALLGLVAWTVFVPAHFSLACWVLAFVLLETGLRRDHEYTLESYVLGAVAGYATLAAFLAVGPDGLLGGWGPGPTASDDWLVLPAAIAISTFAAIRLLRARATGPRPVPAAQGAATVSAALAAAMTLVFEWRVLPANVVGPAWAMTGLALVALGSWKHYAAPRWLGYAVTFFAAFRQISPLLDRAPESTAEIAAGAIVIAAMYAASYLGARGTEPASPEPRASAEGQETAEEAVTTVLAVAATSSFMLWKYRVLPHHLVAPAWAMTATVLAALGYYRRRSSQRWQGYGLAAVAFLSASTQLRDMAMVAGQDAWSAGAVAALVYATAWFAQRSVRAGLDHTIAPNSLLVFGTTLTVLLESRLLSDLMTGPAWTITAAVLLIVGLVISITNLRWQGYVVLILGVVRAGRPVFGEGDPTSTAISLLVACLLSMYGLSLMARQLLKGLDLPDQVRESENTGITGLLAAASAALAGVIVTQARTSLVTLLLALQGLGVVAVGLGARERVMRLSGMTLLLACLLKVFFYDLRELEPLPRIFSFVVLGLVLLGISWIYTRYREWIQKLL